MGEGKRDKIIPHMSEPIRRKFLNHFKVSMLVYELYIFIKLQVSVVFKVLSLCDSLLSRILRGRYFKDRDFLKANPLNLEKHCVWEGVVLEGLCRWKVGSGSHTLKYSQSLELIGKEVISFKVKLEFHERRVNSLISKGGIGKKI